MNPARWARLGSATLLLRKKQLQCVQAFYPTLAAAAGLKQIRETEMIEDDGVFDLTVDLVTSTSHRVSLSKLKACLESSGRDPCEAAAKTKLR